MQDSQFVGHLGLQDRESDLLFCQGNGADSIYLGYNLWTFYSGRPCRCYSTVRRYHEAKALFLWITIECKDQLGQASFFLLSPMFQWWKQTDWWRTTSANHLSADMMSKRDKDRNWWECRDTRRPGAKARLQSPQEPSLHVLRGQPKWLSIWKRRQRKLVVEWRNGMQLLEGKPWEEPICFTC